MGLGGDYLSFLRRRRRGPFLGFFVYTKPLGRRTRFVGAGPRHAVFTDRPRQAGAFLARFLAPANFLDQSRLFFYQRARAARRLGDFVGTNSIRRRRAGIDKRRGRRCRCCRHGLYGIRFVSFAGHSVLELGVLPGHLFRLLTFGRYRFFDPRFASAAGTGG